MTQLEEEFGTSLSTNYSAVVVAGILVRRTRPFIGKKEWTRYRLPLRRLLLSYKWPSLVRDSTVIRNQDGSLLNLSSRAQRSSHAYGTPLKHMQILDTGEGVSDARSP